MKYNTKDNYTIETIPYNISFKINNDEFIKLKGIYDNQSIYGTLFAILRLKDQEVFWEQDNVSVKPSKQFNTLMAWK